MKHLTLLLAAWLFAAGLLSSASAVNLPASTEPTIRGVRGRTVTVLVPDGFERIELQQKMLARRGAPERWQTLATNYPRGHEAVVNFTLKSLVSRRYLRVLGERTESPTGNLLTGLTTFAADRPALPRFSFPLMPDGGFVIGSGVINFGNAPDAATSLRTVEESDIWKVQGNRLYFFNELRGLQVFDVADPSAPALLGTLRLPGAGEEMYLLGGTHAVLLKQAFQWWPQYISFASTTVTGPANNALNLTSPTISLNPRLTGSESSELVIADVRAGAPQLAARIAVEGSIVESRMVGAVLYVASNVSRLPTPASPEQYGLQLSSFDLSDPARPVQRATIFLGGWADAVTATDRFFLAAKSDGSTGSLIDLIDLSAPDGTLRHAGQVRAVGQIRSKFHIHLEGNVLTAVATTSRPPPLRIPVTNLQTFSIADPAAPTLLGSLEIAPGETLHATRFDAGRAYVVTFRRVDPLFVVDLRNPARPRIAGHVEVPGFSTYIEPLGDRLVTIGVINGQPAITLFDVANPATPRVLSQLQLSTPGGWANSEAVDNEKAFKVLPEENLILLPLVGHDAGNGWFSGVQLVDLLPDTLVKRGTIQHAFSPRRATLIGKSIVSISSSRLVSVNAQDRDRPAVTADLEIAWRVDRVFALGDYLVQLGGSADWNDTDPPVLSVSPKNNTDATLAALELPGLPIRGATVEAGVLYLAQGSHYIYNGETTDRAELANTLKVSAYDVSQLPRLSLLGSARGSVPAPSGELTAHWPSPGILVWSGVQSAYVGYTASVTTPLFTVPLATSRTLNVPVGGSLSVSSQWASRDPQAAGVWLSTQTRDGGLVARDPQIAAPWITQPETNSVRLLAFDFTRPRAPKFLSALHLGAEQPWQLSAPFANGGRLHLSYRHLGGVTPPAASRASARSLPKQVVTDPLSRTNRHYLVSVDYANPALPVINDTQINLPGKLIGLARDATLLFTTGQGYDLTTGAGNPATHALHVSAFDGAAAHLLDTVPLASETSKVVIDGEMILTLETQNERVWVPPPTPVVATLPQDAYPVFTSHLPGGFWKENMRSSLLTAWKLDAAAKFTKLAAQKADYDSTLVLFNRLAITTGYNGKLHLFDASESGQLESLGTYTFPQGVWPNLPFAAGGLEQGLWVPVGRHGIETVADAPPGN